MIPIKHEKTVTATNIITFMGLQLNKTQMVTMLPDDKLLKLRSLLTTFKSNRKIKLRDLQSLGLLNFCCQVVLPGRAFLRELTDLTKGILKPHHKKGVGIVQLGTYLLIILMENTFY